MTNDADVKDDFVEDEPALKAMFDLAKVKRYSMYCVGKFTPCNV